MIHEIDQLEEKCSELDNKARRVKEEVEAARRQSASQATELQVLQGELEATIKKLTEAEQRTARYRAEKFKAEREIQDIHWEQSKKDHTNNCRLEKLQEVVSYLNCAYQSAFAMNRENEDLCTCLQLRLKAKSDQMLNSQKQNTLLRQSLNCRIAELMQRNEAEEENNQTDDERSVHELARENELLKSRVRFLAKLLITDGRTDIGSNQVEKSLYDRVVSELRTLEVSALEYSHFRAV